MYTYIRADEKMLFDAELYLMYLSMDYGVPKSKV